MTGTVPALRRSRDEGTRKQSVAGAVKVPAVLIRAGMRTAVEDLVAEEAPVTIAVDGQEVLTLLCSPFDLDSLAVGCLFSEGILKSREEIKKVTVDGRKGVVRVMTKAGRGADPQVLGKRVVPSGAGKGASFYRLAGARAGLKAQSRLRMRAQTVLDLVARFQHISELRRTTHGVHSAALCDARRIVMFADDIGRHNAMDRIIGRCVLTDVPAASHGLILSGRISSEMLLKAARAGIAVLISVASPTSVTVRLAGEIGLTVVGRVRGGRMNVYSADWRILT